MTLQLVTQSTLCSQTPSQEGRRRQGETRHFLGHRWVSQAITHTTLNATALRICCKCVFARPIWRDQPISNTHTTSDGVPQYPPGRPHATRTPLSSRPVTCLKSFLVYFSSGGEHPGFGFRTGTRRPRQPPSRCFLAKRILITSYPVTSWSAHFRLCLPHGQVTVSASQLRSRRRYQNRCLPVLANWAPQRRANDGYPILLVLVTRCRHPCSHGRQDGRRKESFGRQRRMDHLHIFVIGIVTGVISTCVITLGISSSHVSDRSAL